MHKFNFLKMDKGKWGKQKILKPKNKQTNNKKNKQNTHTHNTNKKVLNYF